MQNTLPAFQVIFFFFACLPGYFCLTKISYLFHEQMHRSSIRNYIQAYIHIHAYVCVCVCNICILAKNLPNELGNIFVFTEQKAKIIILKYQITIKTMITAMHTFISRLYE